MNTKLFAFLILLASFTTTLSAWAGYTFENGVLTVDGTIDLDGKALRIEGITSVTGSGKFTNSVAVADLTLGLDMDVTLSTVTIEGNIRLVKTGVKTLTLPKNSTYAGGTWIQAGRLTADSGSNKQLNNFKPFGAYETVITVESGGMLDLKGYYNWKKHYSIVLNGGTLSNAAQKDSTSEVFDPDLTVTGNSIFELKSGKIYSFAAHANLGGNTLTMRLGGNLHWLPSAVGSGTINVTGSSIFQVDKTATYSDLTLDMGAPMDLQKYTLGVKDYIATYVGNGNKATGALEVSGTFTPSSDNFYPCTMMGGSTIDLSGKTSTWSLTNASGDGVKFAARATVTIDVGARTIAAKDKIVDWPEGTEYSGRTFVLKANGGISEDLELQVSATGLTVAARGAKVPTATWTGAIDSDAGKAGNWSWENVPEPTPGVAPIDPSKMLPGPSTAVVIPWAKLATFNWSEDIAYATIEFSGDKPTETVVLNGDRDWRGLGALDVPFALDLNGHKLYIVLPEGSSANETEVTSTAEGGELHATVATDKVHDNTSVALTGNLSLIKEGPGAFVATKYPQTYTGETIVNEGTLRAADGANVNADSTTAVTNSPFGASRTITVGPEGVLDPRGSYSWGYHTVNLDGGAISNTVAQRGVGTTAYNVAAENYKKPFNPRIVLLADSTFATTKEFNFNGEVVADGHELEIWIASGQGLLWVPKAAENAVFVVTNGGYLKTLKNHTFDQKTATLKFMGGTVDLAGDLVVSNYYVATSVTDYQFDTRPELMMTVSGTFTPVSQNFFGCQMLDGATIDLSGQKASWSSHSALVNSHMSTKWQGECRDVTFAEGEKVTKVTIDVGSREFRGETQIVSWSEGSKVSAAGAKFVLSAAAKARGYRLTRDENGLYIGPTGFVLLIQ